MATFGYFGCTVVRACLLMVEVVVNVVLMVVREFGSVTGVLELLLDVGDLRSWEVRVLLAGLGACEILMSNCTGGLDD